MKVVISVINYNSKKDTQDCLNTIDNLEQEGIDIEVVILDNNSQESFSQRDINLKKVPFKFISESGNEGFAQGHNIVLKYAIEKNADFVMILNNDTLLDKSCLKELIKTFKDNIGIAVPKIYFAKGYEFHKKRYQKEELGRVIWYAGGKMDWRNVLGKHRGVDEVDKGQYDKLCETEFASGCCMLIKKEILEQIGFFDKRYFLYYEDSDLSERVKKAGFKIMYTPYAILWHKNASSTGGSGSILQDYYITRNRLLFGVKYAPFKSKLALLKESLSLLFNGRQWQKQGVLDFYLRRFEKGSFKI